ncbi:RecQ family ATP-dependent DNA helicase [Arenibacter sp. M-2]|uniref:RecQ family ATP-dependent DNA helicase n=1 Tax=Arenibacter sp. M-2 TaxID=3053612 RepID=UPI00256FBB0C|nr:RecQ family ATP-dependent DNA helicase [Arenibacter sp. M-2]MDL5511956.1 RecQ family ATP-dependent DNA helicase [Arenibacter sp. M-2]
MHQHPKDILKKVWGFPDFKNSQEDIIGAVLEGQDVMALLPTGGGKSLCYQVPALAREGICIVVSPLIALIRNQVDTLKKLGLKAIALTGGISFEEVNNLLDNCLYGNYKFLYLSPERLQQELVKERIRQMNVNLIAIDEAHCISQWGNDFRPAYLECHILKELAPNAPMIALTATATETVVKDICENLHLEQPLVVKDSFSRNNITFSVCLEEDKKYRLKELCAQTNTSTIVYVRSRKMTMELSYYLTRQGHTATFFHGGISKKDKDSRLNQWLENKVKIMVATNAFGMGIDKPDVGLVVHYQIPDSMENYFQEAGRAGRDGKPARAVLITNPTDEAQVRKQFLGVLPNVDFLKLLYRKLANYFQIPFGEGSGETYQLPFNAFCETYKLNTTLTYNGLRLLDQNSVISLTEAFSQKTTIRMLASKHQIFDYLDKNQASAPIIQTILRTYGGVFDFDTKINSLLISRKANKSEKEVITVLEKLEKDEIIEYHAQHSDLEITFLVPREDERTINIFAKKIKQIQQVKKDNVESMLSYIKDVNLCRSRYILNYFGEAANANCGKCDVCLQKNPIGNEVLKIIEQDILQVLMVKKESSRSLMKLLSYKESSIILALQRLLEEQRIRVNSINQYEIIKK